MAEAKRPNPIDHLRAAGYLDDAFGVEIVGEGSIKGKFHVSVFDRLKADERFANGNLGALHNDVGADIHDFRAYKNTFGNGSLQIVMDKKTGAFYADVDGWNPYQDVVNWIGHSFGEVVPHFVGRLFRRGRKK